MEHIICVRHRERSLAGPLYANERKLGQCIAERFSAKRRRVISGHEEVAMVVARIIGTLLHVTPSHHEELSCGEGATPNVGQLHSLLKAKSDTDVLVVVTDLAYIRAILGKRPGKVRRTPWPCIGGAVIFDCATEEITPFPLF